MRYAVVIKREVYALEDYIDAGMEEDWFSDKFTNRRHASRDASHIVGMDKYIDVTVHDQEGFDAWCMAEYGDTVKLLVV